MARTTQIIFDEMKAEALTLSTGNATLTAMFNNTSKVAIWKVLFYAIAYCIMVFEKIQDNFIKEVNTTIANEKRGTLTWYNTIAKLFQYGYSLPADSDTYDNTALTQNQIDTSRIIKNAAVIEQQLTPTVFGLRIKLAKTVGADLGPLTTSELNAFKAYIERVKFAGTRISCSTSNPDDLKLDLKVYYNPLILDASGARLDGTNATPIKSAIDYFMKNLPFNGQLVLEHLTDHLQTVDGVSIPHIILSQARYGALPYSPIDMIYNPDSGYVRITNINLTVNYVAQV
jgi:hypothetical protein